MFNSPERNPNFINKKLKYEDTLEQFNDDTKIKAIFPGDLKMYNIKDQCQQIFGPESDACEQNLDVECRVLWCKADTRDQQDSSDSIQCVTTNTKWADGTPCGISEPTVICHILY